MTFKVSFNRPEQRPAWLKLQALAQSPDLHLRQMLSDRQRSQDLCVHAAGLTLDASHQRVNGRVLSALQELAEQSHLLTHIQAMFNGERVNTTEDRAALHVALRGSASPNPPWGSLIAQQVQAEQNRFLNFVDDVQLGRWHGFDGRAITDVVNLGIGGSDLGPRMATHALTTAIPKMPGPVRVHFVSNVDPTAMSQVLSLLQPATTAFVVQSKTLTTQETLRLAQSARRWLADAGCPHEAQARHLVAVTARPELAFEQGFDPEQTFVFWDWVGGRYSVWSAIGLPLALAIGSTEFRRFLQGARDMDEHLLQAPFSRNMPMLMAMLGVWNGNFLRANSLNMAPYAYALSQFVPFVQQLDMESNGKSTHTDGTRVSVQTGPIIWGGLGINGQHAYYQLIHQGSHLVPVDFIGVRECHDALPEAQAHHQIVLNNLQAQAKAMALGRDLEQTRKALLGENASTDQIDAISPHRVYPGNNPSSTLWLQSINAHSLGALIALYEHKVYCQSVIWGVNPFDQWGVELGKTMLRELDAPL